jgi:hypothetical protein
MNSFNVWSFRCYLHLYVHLHKAFRKKASMCWVTIDHLWVFLYIFGHSYGHIWFIIKDYLHVFSVLQGKNLYFMTCVYKKLVVVHIQALCWAVLLV